MGTSVPARTAKDYGGPVPRLTDTLRSEWVKMRTLRSTPITLGITALLVVGLSALVVWLVVSHPRNNGITGLPDSLRLIQAGWGFGNLAFLVLGVLVVSNEYSSGMIVSALLGTPRRAKLLTAKVCVFAAVVFVVAEVMSFVNFYLGQAVLSSHPAFPDPALGDNNVLRAVVGMGITATLVGLMGLGLGALLRHTAGAITIGVAMTLVLPPLFLILPSSWSNPIEEYWPTEAGDQLERLTRDAHTLSAWWGTGDFALFIALLLLVAGYLFVRRDA
jgi:hypothetical protein